MKSEVALADWLDGCLRERKRAKEREKRTWKPFHFERSF